MLIARELMAPLMFGGLVVFMLIGFPVAFSLAAVGLFFGFIAIESGYFQFAFMQALPERVFGIISNDTLLAIPFFTLMGAILERCGLAEDLLDGLGQLFGPVRGGLGYAVIIVGFILGAITGTVAGQVIAMTMIALPVMLRHGYDPRYATGVLAASGTITQLVPPSLVLVVLADQLGQPVGDMYKGAWGPSALQVLMFAAYTFYLSRRHPELLPAIPRTHQDLPRKALWLKCLRGIIPSAVLIFAVLGSMVGFVTLAAGLLVVQRIRWVQAVAWIQRKRSPFGAAPTFWPASSPPLNSISVGIERMPYCEAMPGFSSTLTLARTTLPAFAPTTFSRIGPSRSSSLRRATRCWSSRTIRLPVRPHVLACAGKRRMSNAADASLPPCRRRSPPRPHPARRARCRTSRSTRRRGPCSI